MLTMDKKTEYRLMYKWADNLFEKGELKATLLHTLKAVISCTHLAMPTIKQINEARNKSILKFAHIDMVCNKTISRHLKTLTAMGLIEKKTTQDGWYSRNEINIPAIKQAVKLVASPRDIVNPSIPKSSCTTSLSNNHNHKRDIVRNENDIKTAEQKTTMSEKIQSLPSNHVVKHLKSAAAKERVMVPVGGSAVTVKYFTADEKYIYDKLIAVGVFRHFAAEWVNNFTVAQLANLIEAAKLYGARRPGAYIHKSIKELNEKSELEKQREQIDPIAFKPWVPGEKVSRSDEATAKSWLGKLKSQVAR